MCVSKGAPLKPSYGPCNERHSFSDLVAAMVFMAAMAPLLQVMESALKSQMKEELVCV